MLAMTEVGSVDARNQELRLGLPHWVAESQLLKPRILISRKYQNQKQSQALNPPVFQNGI